MATVVGLFSYGGYLLDQKTGLSPLFLLLGLFLGGFGGFIHLVSVISPEMLPFGKRRLDAMKTQRKNDRPDDPETNGS